jgi:two-component system cell cycle sensor histidine kinase/response regulator CckA
VTIEVEDDGPGIHRDEVPLIFEPFYSSRTLGTASGLGLAAVEQIVRERGGFISVRSEPGCGARFLVGLPLASGSPAAGSGPHDLPLPAARAVGRILLVDDERTVLGALEQALEAAGHDVLAADRGEKALDLLAGGRQLDLLITDIVMPDMDGFELADQVREGQPDIPVLFITGYGEEVLASRGLDGSKVEILQKPFRMVDLLARVELLLARAVAVGSGQRNG